MDAIKKVLVFLLLSTVLGLTLAVVMPKEVTRDTPETLMVGCGDDITDRLLDQVLAQYQADGHQGVASAEGDNALDMNAYSFIDCCSNTGQWALLTKDIDMGFYCSHAAVNIVNQVEGFSIFGPVVMNAEVLAYRDSPQSIRLLGVPAKREHLRQMVQEQYPWVEEIKEVSADSILYAFTDHQLDGAVMDISRAFQMPDHQYTRVSDQDYVSFCLVVRDDIVQTPQFQTFIQYYNETVEQLNDLDHLQELYGMDDQFWAEMPLKFLYLQEPQAGRDGQALPEKNMGVKN